MFKAIKANHKQRFFLPRIDSSLESSLINFFYPLIPKSDIDLVFIHVGKCGGGSVWNTMISDQMVLGKYNKIKRTHTAKPIYKKDTNYLIIIRNPVCRLASCFNWRKNLLIDKKDLNRISGFQKLQPEINVLNKYGNIDNLAIKLYNNNIIDPNVWEDLMKIYHVEMGIDFYLNPFLDKIDKKQIVGVLSQHSLSKDYEKLFGSKGLQHINSSKQISAHISDEGRKNLAKAFYFEFDAIKKLNSIFPIGEEKLARLLKWHSTEV